MTPDHTTARQAAHGLDPNSVLSKVMDVLHAFTLEDHALRFADICERTGLPKATAHRVVSDMVAARLVDREGDRYRLGGHLFELGMRASIERTLLEVATPFLEDLYERTHETVHLGIREGAEVVYVAKFGGHRQAAAPSRLGGRMPLHATAIGKVLLAYATASERTLLLSGPLQRFSARTITAPGILDGQLDTIRDRGVGYEFEESKVGIVCVAAAVLDGDDRALAAISVTGPINRFRPQNVAADVHAAAAGVASTLARRAASRAGD